MNASYVFGSSYFGSNEWLAPSTAAPAPSGGLFSSKTTAPATGAAPTPATGGLFGAGKETSSDRDGAASRVCLSLPGRLMLFFYCFASQLQRQRRHMQEECLELLPPLLRHPRRQLEDFSDPVPPPQLTQQVRRPINQ